MTSNSARELPGIFASFGEARRNGFLAVKKLKDEGRGVVGTFCTYAPVEIFMAAGLVPVGLCSTSDETVPDAEKHLPRNLCPLIKASYGFAITDKCPYMYFSDLVVGETTCDGKKKMYELLGKIKDVHVMELPQNQTRTSSKALWLSEVMRLKARVEEKFGVAISNDDIIRAIKERNLERRKLKELYELSMASPPPMTGLSQLQLLFGSQFKFDHRAKVAEIESTVLALKKVIEEKTSPVPAGAKRIMLTGCPMGGVTEKVTRAVEQSGAVVVVYENCTGAKQFDRQVPETGDPWEALAEYHLAIGCAVMTPNPNRLDLLQSLAERFKVDGVVEMTLTACQPYGVETSTIREFLAGLGVPFMSLETDYSQADLELLKTRAQAFVETLS
ncbi:MAG: 2-hydroxyacyl-CoA dehydratase family protein [Deltaproteobacteria bacterium]|jgi:benzoyl-CoA reductase/2-hydroxyglutaryl-CoA dehydratase subunit BcrC/BadD/HgdB|nr:2-hydroxyacyl-CoA dehydratase family protein [Deltaproteobacteria bacterium]